MLPPSNAAPMSFISAIVALIAGMRQDFVGIRADEILI
jgi:hypothetical protein